MPEITPVWTTPFRVREHELDARGRLSIPALCLRLQDAASRHAGELGFSVERLRRDGLTWVLSRLVVSIEDRPGPDADYTLRTWPSGADGLFATRDFLVEGHRTAVRATTAWLMVDVRRKRPVRLPEAVAGLALRAERALVDSFERLPSLGGSTTDRPILTGWSDLDVNRHVNHVRFVSWLIDAIPQEVAALSEPLRLEVHFRAESGSDRHLVARTEPVADHVFRQSILDPSDGTVCVDARSGFNPA